MGLGSRFASILESRGPLCVGIDPSTDALRTVGLHDTAEGALEFGRAIVAVSASRVGIVKPQVAYFERFGSAGYGALETLIREAREAGLVVIADAKRGDIGSTMEGYATAWLGDGPLQSDALTVSPYQGFAALEPVFSRAETNGATVFVLSSTSNPDADDVQRASLANETLPRLVARYARQRSGNTRTVGVVVGATRDLAARGLTASDLDGLLILAPGFGAQGASLRDISDLFGAASTTVIPSVSRSVVQHGLANCATAIEEHLRELGL
ncbi:MAG: orotidine-5'-phosphate decarboxylase [Microbacteriaceae bacterium]|nr:orotidine-5'-phosphate decarboxylase [Microbacteriaceae bacterium]